MIDLKAYNRLRNEAIITMAAADTLTYAELRDAAHLVHRLQSAGHLYRKHSDIMTGLSVRLSGALLRHANRVEFGIPMPNVGGLPPVGRGYYEDV